MVLLTLSETLKYALQQGWLLLLKKYTRRNGQKAFVLGGNKVLSRASTGVLVNERQWPPYWSLSQGGGGSSSIINQPYLSYTPTPTLIPRTQTTSKTSPTVDPGQSSEVFHH
jgi:hypothetical protein